MNTLKISPNVLEQLAEVLHDVEWSVFAWCSEGVGEAFLCPDDHDPSQSCTRPFADRESATAFADELRAGVRHAQELHGIGIIGDVVPYVLANGIPWDER